MDICNSGLDECVYYIKALSLFYAEVVSYFIDFRSLYLLSLSSFLGFPTYVIVQPIHVGLSVMHFVNPEPSKY